MSYHDGTSIASHFMKYIARIEIVALADLTLPQSRMRRTLIHFVRRPFRLVSAA